MANKKSKNTRPEKTSENQEKSRTRMFRIFLVIFSTLLILSLILSLTATF